MSKTLPPLPPLPCPFCGKQPKTTERPDNIDGTQFFFAVGCYCGTYSASAHKMAVRNTPEQAKSDAISAWNARAAIERQSVPAFDSVRLTRFLTDVVTAAGLLSHGKQSKAVAERVAKEACAIRSMLAAAPQPQPVQQEPVGWIDAKALEELEKQEMNWMPVWNRQNGTSPIALYTSPQAAQPLSDDLINDLARTMVKEKKSVNWLAYAIEAAHGIKE